MLLLLFHCLDERIDSLLNSVDVLALVLLFFQRAQRAHQDVQLSSAIGAGARQAILLQALQHRQRCHYDLARHISVVPRPGVVAASRHVLHGHLHLLGVVRINDAS
jgi:hypothetical protein